MLTVETGSTRGESRPLPQVDLNIKLILEFLVKKTVLPSYNIYWFLLISLSPLIPIKSLLSFEPPFIIPFWNAISPPNKEMVQWKKTQDPAGSIHKKAREKTDPQKRVFDDGVCIWKFWFSHCRVKNQSCHRIKCGLLKPIQCSLRPSLVRVLYQLYHHFCK